GSAGGRRRRGAPPGGRRAQRSPAAAKRRGLAGEPRVPPRSYPGHSALNWEAFDWVTTPPSGRLASTSIPPQPLPVLTALITHCTPSLPSVSGRCITVPYHAPEPPSFSPTPPPP